MRSAIQYATTPIFLGRADNDPARWLSGTLVDEGDQQGVQHPGGTWLSVQPDGTYESRATIQGDYERITADPDLNVLHVHPGIPYRIAYRGV